MSKRPAWCDCGVPPARTGIVHASRVSTRSRPVCLDSIRYRIWSGWAGITCLSRLLWIDGHVRCLVMLVDLRLEALHWLSCQQTDYGPTWKQPMVGTGRAARTPRAGDLCRGLVAAHSRDAPPASRLGGTGQTARGGAGGVVADTIVAAANLQETRGVVLPVPSSRWTDSTAGDIMTKTNSLRLCPLHPNHQHLHRHRVGPRCRPTPSHLLPPVALPPL